MMRLTGVVAAVLAVALLVPLSRGLFVASSADPQPPDPREIVAGAVGIDAGDVSILSVRADDHGRKQRVMATVGDGETEKVLVKYESDTGLLRYVRWLGRMVYEPADQSIPIEEAQQQAEQLMSRLFPPVPVDMELVTAERADQIPVYHFRWRAHEVAENVFSGDLVSVSISTITGRPTRYSQVVAHVRPSLEDISVTREQAIAIAIESTERIWRETFGRRVTVEVTKATLVLSSVISTDYGPVWLVKQEVKSADTGDRMELSTRAIDAITGDLLLHSGGATP